MSEEKKHRDDVITKKEFVDSMQQVLTEELGTKVSKEAAWELFKAIFTKIVDMACEKPVSLAGIGKFVVQKTKPRKSKVGKVAFVPRFKLRASSAIDRMVEEKLGVVVPGTERKPTPTKEAKPTPTKEAQPAPPTEGKTEKQELDDMEF